MWDTTESVSIRKYTLLNWSHWLILEILVQKVLFETNLNFRYHRVKNLTKYLKVVCYFNFKSWWKNDGFIFADCFSFWYLKLRFFFLEYFLDEKSQKLPLCCAVSHPCLFYHTWASVFGKSFFFNQLRKKKLVQSRTVIHTYSYAYYYLGTFLVY